MAAPFGNLFAIGNNGGRPRTYTDPEELRKRCEEYFEWCLGEKSEQSYIDENGLKKFVYIREPEPWTVTGLALFLGFVSRRSMSDYEARGDDFSPIIRAARTMVESGYEKRLHGQSATGAIFALKNMDWTDKHEVENSGNLGLQWNETKTYDPEKKQLDDIK